jgi:hypothetical protein
VVLTHFPTLCKKDRVRVRSRARAKVRGYIFIVHTTTKRNTANKVEENQPNLRKNQSKFQTNYQTPSSTINLKL